MKNLFWIRSMYADNELNLFFFFLFNCKISGALQYGIKFLWPLRLDACLLKQIKANTVRGHPRLNSLTDTCTCWRTKRSWRGINPALTNLNLIIRRVEGVNSCMIYLIHFKYLCKSHNIPPQNTTIKGGKDL
jgi:hypothetical protein